MAGLNGIGSQAQVLGNLNLNGNVSGVSQAAATAASNGTKASNVPQATSATVTDKANVSSTGGLVAQALSTPDVRLDKVAALQSAIASGTYQVPASAVAGKIVDSLLK